jgi:hemoglobin
MKGFLLLGLLCLAVVTAPTTAFAARHRHGKGKADRALYNRLGGRKGIAKVVDSFVGRCAGDDRIKAFFAKTAASPKRLAKFKKNLTDQICAAVNGPCKYHGKSMARAHKGMGVGETDFTALVEDLVATLDEFKVQDQDKQAILAKLGPMKDQIVSGDRTTASQK